MEIREILASVSWTFDLGPALKLNVSCDGGSDSGPTCSSPIQPSRTRVLSAVAPDKLGNLYCAIP